MQPAKLYASGITYSATISACECLGRLSKNHVGNVKLSDFSIRYREESINKHCYKTFLELADVANRDKGGNTPIFPHAVV